MNVSTTATSGTSTWNGPVCQTCGATYLGQHQCSPADIGRRIAELARLLDAVQQRPVDRTSGCPCRPENGGSGVCGCVLGGMRITCTTEGNVWNTAEIAREVSRSMSTTGRWV